MIIEKKSGGNLISHEDITPGLLEKISKSQKLWQSIFDAITDYIFVTDGELNLVKVNRACADARNMHPRELIGRKCYEFFHRDTKCPDCIRDDVLADNMPRTIEKVRDDDVFQVSTFPLDYEAEKSFAIHVLKNVTETRRLRNQLFHSYKLASIGRLVSGVAHEINNPLTGILGYAELLGVKTKDESIKGGLGKIYKAAERCREIVDSLFCFSRQQVPHRSLEDINEIIDKTLELRAYWLTSGKVEVIKNYADLPSAYIDIQQIQQVILNILVNAEQAIALARRPGKIVLSTSYDNEKNMAILNISDNGAGISQEFLERIFDPFFTTKPVNKGTGLGLSIAYGIVTEHGGTIKVESTEGDGTAFTVELPVK